MSDDVAARVEAARQELQKLQRKHRDLYTMGESPAAGFVRASEPVPVPTPAASSATAGGGDSVSREEFNKFQESFAKVNELNERIISQNVLLQAELESMARLNAELRSEKAALALRLKKA